jgi:hypothetical protein
MQTETVTIEQFILINLISMTAERTDSNPNMDGDMDHWKVTLRRRAAGLRGRPIVAATMTTYFSQGYGHNGATPTVDSVLDCLGSDASAADESFEDFCSNFGYDTDSRKAEKTYNACKRSGDKLRRFLGEDAFQQLVYGGVERL